MKIKKERVTNNRESGFSLLEVTVAALLTVGLMGVVFGLMSRNQQVFFTESNVTDMNQNMRTAFDLLTRDVQSAGMGLPRTNGSFAAIFYTDGANGAPDSLMMINGNPFAPTADVTDRAAGSAEFFCQPPPDITVTGNGANQTMTFIDKDGQVKPIYQTYSTAPIMYLCYDDTHAMLFGLTQGGQIIGNGANQRLKLQHNPSNYLNPPGIFGTTLDNEEPDYGQATVAMLSSTTAYRVNQTTHELERTTDLNKWYSVARGILNLQIQYRLVSKDINNNIVETVADAPTTRKDIRAVIFTITAETPDIDPNNKNYRQSVQKFEAAPRNFNLLNNTNLSTNQ